MHDEKFLYLIPRICVWTPVERKKERESPVELRVPWNRLFRRRVHENVLVCAARRGIDALVQRETPLNLISRHQVSVVARAETPKENVVAALSALSHVFPGLGLHMDLPETRSTLLTNFQSSLPSFLFLVSFWNELSLLSTNSLENSLACTHVLAWDWVVIVSWGSIRNFESYFWTLI